jgi:hypothetical protein
MRIAQAMASYSVPVADRTVAVSMQAMEEMSEGVGGSFAG